MNKKGKRYKIPQKEKEVLKRYSELKYKTDVLGPGSAFTLQTHTNSSRLIMVNHQVGHAVNIKNPEPALVSTGFENVLAEYSAINEVADRNYRITHKIIKSPYYYVLIGYDDKTRHYHAWERKEVEEHSESFATRYKNTKNDELEVGDVVKAGAFLKKTESYDKYGNYCLGKNLNTVYMISATVLEDGIALMNGAENKMNTFRCYTVSVPINDNEVLLNLYGDKKSYKTFPEIGEKIKKGVLAAVRTIDNSKAPYSLKDRALRSIEEGDRVYNVSGRVIDIDIRYNKDRSSLIEAKTNAQVNGAYIHQQDFYLELYNTMREITAHAEDEGYTYSDEFSMICATARNYVDSSAFFSDYNESVFGNMIIDFTIMDEEKLAPGSKLVGRSGNKGVVSKIYSSEESWMMEDGTPVEVVLSALGIVGRLNPSQLNEHSINELTQGAVNRMKTTDDVEEKFRFAYDVLKLLNEDEAKEMKKFFKNLSDKEKKKFCKNIEDNGIIVVQDPIDNVNILDIEKAYDKYPARWQRIIFPDGCRSIRKVLCAKLYYLRLKQDPKDKYSARGRGPVNALHGMPNKSNRKKRYLDLFSDVPVRLGNSEIDVMNNNNEPEANADYMAENSTSIEAKDQLAEAYTADPTEEVEVAIDNNTSKGNADMLAAHLMVLGSQLEFVYEGEELEDDDNTFVLGEDESEMDDEDTDSDEPGIDDFEDDD